MYYTKIINTENDNVIAESASNTPPPAIVPDTSLILKHSDEHKNYYVHIIETIMEPHEGLLDGCSWTTIVYVVPN